MSDLGYYTVKEMREDQDLFENDFGTWLERHGVDYEEGFAPLLVAPADCKATGVTVDLHALKLGIARLMSQAADAETDHPI